MTQCQTAGSQRTIRVVIADDSKVMLETLALAVVRPGEIDVVATAPDAATLMTILAATQPDVVLLDLRFGDDWGFDLIPEIRGQDSRPEVIVLSAVAGSRTQPEADRAGAFDQLAKGCRLEDIQDAIVAAAEHRRGRSGS